MTNKKLTDERLSQIGRKHFYPTCGESYVPFGDEVVSMVRELQEYRKSNQVSYVTPGGEAQHICQRCGIKTTHPEGWHYCHKS